MVRFRQLVMGTQSPELMVTEMQLCYGLAQVILAPESAVGQTLCFCAPPAFKEPFTCVLVYIACLALGAQLSWFSWYCSK